MGANYSDFKILPILAARTPNYKRCAFKYGAGKVIVPRIAKRVADTILPQPYGWGILKAESRIINTN